MNIFGNHFGGSSSFQGLKRLKYKLFLLLAAFTFTVAAADVIDDDGLDFSSRDPISLVKASHHIIRASFAPKTESFPILPGAQVIEFPSFSVFLSKPGFYQTYHGRSPPVI